MVRAREVYAVEARPRPVDALAERIRLISHAEERIILSTFEFRNDESGKDMMAAFLAAADRGVEVEILMDGFPAFKNLQLTQDPYFQALSSHENIQIALYNPVNLLQPWKLMGRLHDKYLIADSTAYILGGRNTYDYFLGDYGDYKNYDWDVLVYSEEPGQGESMNALLAYFTEVWELPLSRIWKDDPGSRSHGRILRAREALEERYASMQKEHPDWFADCDYEKNTKEVNHIELLSNPTHCQAKEPVVYYEMTELMKQAEGEVYFHTPYIICNDWMGGIGAILAILGVVAAPVTSGDTAFRCARLIASDILKLRQDTIWRRLAVSMPLFVIAAVLMNVNFDILWRYFAWFNQTLSIFTFWALTVWLARNGRNFIVTLLPALFMTAVCTSYILVAPEGFRLPQAAGVAGGIAAAMILGVLYFRWLKLFKANLHNVG